MTRAKTMLALVLAMSLVALPSPAEAGSCTSGAKVAGDLWDAFEKETKEAGCLSPAKRRGRYAACYLEASKIPARLGAKMVGFWNSMAKNGWATLGPRRIESGKNKGTLRGVKGVGGRLFVGSSPTNTEELEITLSQVDGMSRAEVTVCLTTPDRKTRKIWEFTTDKPEKKKGEVVPRTWRKVHKGIDVDGAIVSVHLDSLHATNKFEYTLEVEAKPRRNNLGPVKGFADLHVHQMVEMAHGGSWYWGGHTGPLNRAMRTCSHKNHGVLPKVDNMTAHGRFDADWRKRDWPRWDNINHQQVHADWLKRAHEQGLNLMVMHAVNFEGLCYALKAFYPNQHTNWGCRDMDSVERQLDAAIAFSEAHDWYELAMDPWHARQIIHEGKLAVVLSFEASHLFPKKDGDDVAQLDRLYAKGLRSLVLAHETDSEFAGAAPHDPLFGYFQGIKWPQKFLANFGDQKPFDHLSGFKLDERGKNAHGLSESGKRLVKEMMDRHMLVDITHLSERSFDDVYEIARRRKYYPLFDSHTRFDAVMTKKDLEKQREFLTTCTQARRLEETGGMVGLRTGPNLMKTFTGGRVKVENNCPGSSRSFAQLYDFALHKTGLELAFGSDLNGNIQQVGPRHGDNACHMVAVNEKNPKKSDPEITEQADQGDRPRGVSDEFNETGLSHIGLLPDLVKDLGALGLDTRPLESSAEAFLRMWERTYDAKRQAMPVKTQCGSAWADLARGQRSRTLVRPASKSPSRLLRRPQ